MVIVNKIRNILSGSNNTNKEESSDFTPTYVASKAETERFSPELCREIAMRHHVGERIDVVVSNIVPYGVFCSIDGTAYNGLLHVTGIKGLGNRAPEDVFRRGQELSCTIKGIELDPKVKIFLETTVAETEAAPRAFSPKPNPECIAAKWVQENPGVSEDAHKWLVSMVKDAPLHGSLLSELRERFGIPKPVSGWIRLFDDLESLPAVNDRCPHPVVGLRSRMHDKAYLDIIRTALPAENASPKVTPKANKPAATVQDGAKLILVDASCLLRNDAFGLAGCEALMNSLKANGFKPFALIDAATPHNLDDAGKAFVNELAASGDGKVVPGGTRADDYLLALADKMGVDIVSYDRYRDFTETYPWTQWTQEKEGKRRIHAPEFLFDRIVIPSLGICD